MPFLKVDDAERRAREIAIRIERGDPMKGSFFMGGPVHMPVNVSEAIATALRETRQQERAAWQSKLLSLLSGEHSSLLLSYNDSNGPNYMTVAELAEQGHDEGTDWVSDEEKQKAIEGNSMWTLHWYPDTPVGFFSISASSLDAIMQAIEERATESAGHKIESEVMPHKTDDG